MFNGNKGEFLYLKAFALHALYVLTSSIRAQISHASTKHSVKILRYKCKSSLQNLTEVNAVMVK